MAQVSYGTITISDLTDITDVYLQYALVADTITRYQDIPAGTTWSEIYPTWQSGYQIWIRQVTEKEGLPNEYGTPYLDTAVNQLNIDINAEETARLALANKLKKIWINLNPTVSYPAGTYAAAGINNADITESNASTYGFNTWLSHAALKLRYNAIDLTTLSTSGLSLYYPLLNNNIIVNSALGAEFTNNQLNFYQPPTVSGNTVTQGKKTMMLDEQSLTFYNPGINGTNNKGIELNSNGLYLYKPLASGESGPQTTAAQLSATGLNITEGSITLGENDEFQVTSAGILTATEATITGIINADTGYIGGNSGWTIASQELYSGILGEDNSMFLSTKNLEGTIGTVTLPPENEATLGWRFTVGSNFGVDNEGNLYADNANLTGATVDGEITATSLMINSGGTTYDGIEAFNTSKYITDIGEDGISIHSSNNNNDRIEITDCVEIIKQGISVASYGETTVIGNKGSFHIAIGAWYKLTEDDDIIVDKSYYTRSGITPDYIYTLVENPDVADIGTYYEKMKPELGFYEGESKIAYISNNQLCIDQSVVLRQMDLGTMVVDNGLGQWSWKIHPNGQNPSRNNLNLKWVG